MKAPLAGFRQSQYRRLQTPPFSVCYPPECVPVPDCYFRTVLDCFLAFYFLNLAGPTHQAAVMPDQRRYWVNLRIWPFLIRIMSIWKPCAATMLTPALPFATVPRKGKPNSVSFYLLKKVVVGGSDRFPPHNRPITIVEDRICHKNQIIFLPGVKSHLF